MKYQKSHESLNTILNHLSKYFGDEWADDYVNKRLIDLHEIIKRGTLAIQIAKDMNALNDN